MTQLQVDLDKIDGASEDEMPLLTLRFLARIANALERIATTAEFTAQTHPIAWKKGT